METGSLLHKAFVSQSKALLSLLLLLVLILLLCHSETLMPTMWRAFTGFFEGPVFAFLLLNCLIVTIIASSRLESEKGPEHEEASKRETMRQMEKGDEKGVCIEENVIRRSGIIGELSHINSSITNGDDYHMNEGEDFVGSNCSLNAKYKKQIIIKKEAINVNEKNSKPIKRARLHPNKPLISDLKEKKLMRGASHHAKPALQKSYDNLEHEKCIKGLGGAGNIIDNRSQQAEKPAPAPAMALHPSLEEVWAAIMLTKKSDHHMAASMQATDHLSKGSSDGYDNQALAAATPPAAATDARSQPVATATTVPPATACTPPAAAAAAPNPPGAPSVAPASAIEKHEDTAVHDSELEELNRRAEEFIARFKNQIRLQRQESLQRKRRRRPCSYDIQYSNHMQQLQAPGLLVG